MIPPSPNSALAAGVVAIVLWSTAATVAGLLAGYVSYGSIALYPVMSGAVMFGLVLVPKRRAFVRETLALSNKRLAFLITAGFALAVYELCFFYSLTHAPRVQANIINYLWPVFLILFSSLLEGSLRRLPLLDWLFVSLALVGAALTALGSMQIHSLGLHNPAYAFAFLGAISIGLYMAILRKARAYHSNPLYTYVLSIFFAIPFIIILGLIFRSGFTLPRTPIPLLLILYEGIIVFGIGYMCWIYAIQHYTSITLSSIIYLTPVIGILWLRSVLGDPIHANAVYGASLIVSANFALHARYRHTSASSSSMVFALLVGLLCYLSPGMGRTASPVAMIDIVGLVFAIFAGFTLNRVVARHQQEDLLQTSIATSCYQLLALCSLHLPGAMIDRLRISIDKLFRKIIDYTFCATAENGEQMTQTIYASATEVHDMLEGPIITDLNLREKVVLARAQLYESIDRWLYLRADRLTFGEAFALFLLGSLTLILFIVGRDNSFAGDLTAVAFGTGVIYLLFTVHDYDRKRIDKDFAKILITQRIFRANGLEYYLPKQLLDSRNFPAPPARQRFRYENEKGLLKTVIVEPEHRLPEILLKVSFLGAVASLISLLYSKHS